MILLRQRYAALPNWRKPYGESVATEAQRRCREQRSMCDAVLDIVGGTALTRDQIAAALRDDWGDCSERDVGNALRILRRDGDLRRLGVLYSRVDL